MKMIRTLGLIAISQLFVISSVSLGQEYAYRVYFTDLGTKNFLANTDVRYDSGSPVVAMTAYKGGVLTAFAGHAGGDKYVVHWSSDGENLVDGPIRYLARSPVEAMIVYKGGVLTAFSKAGPNGHRIHWSPDGDDLGNGPIRYDAGSPVVATSA